MSVPVHTRTMVFVLSLVLCVLGSQIVTSDQSTKTEEVQALFDAGMRVFFADDSETAIKRFREALQVDPDFPDAHWMLMWHGPEEERDEHCRAIMRLDPHSEYAYVAKLVLEGKPLAVYGNPETWRFHLASCIGLPLNEMIRFKSAEEAVVAWYEGCPYCNADPNNLLATQQTENRASKERFGKVMQDIQRSIAQHLGTASVYRSRESYHETRAASLAETAKSKIKISGPASLIGGILTFEMTDVEANLPTKAEKSALLKQAAQQRVYAAWNAAKAQGHEYVAGWSRGLMDEKTRKYRAEVGHRHARRLEADAGACVRQALDIRGNGRAQQAVELLVRATQLQPNNAKYQDLLVETTRMWADELLAKAQTTCNAGDFDTAITLAQGVVALYPEEPKAALIVQEAQEGKLRRILEQANKLLQAGAYEDALAELHKGEEFTGAETALLEELSKTYAAAKKRVQETKQQALASLITQADQLLAQGRYKEAQGRYQTALEAGGDEGVLNHNIAVCEVFPDITRLYAQAKASQSWATYLQLLEAAVGYEEETAALLKDAPRQAQLMRSVLLERAGDLPGAGEAYRCFARGSQPPSQASAEQAQACLAVAVQQGSRVPPATFRSLTHEVLPALAYAVEAVRLYPDSATAQAYTSLLFTALGHFDRGHIHALEAVKNDPAQPLSHTASLIDAILAKQGERATKDAKWLLGHAGEIGYIHYLAACAFQLAGEVRRAQRELNIAAAKDPNFYSIVGSRPRFKQAFGHCMNAINQDMPSDVSPDEMDDFSIDALMTILTTARPMK